MTATSTTCFGRAATGLPMSTASDMMAAFDAMSNVNAGDVMVTRTANAAGTSFAFSIYFQGPSVQGQVLQVSTVSCGAIIPTTVSVVTVAQGGFTEVQTVRVNVDSGYIAGGGLFKLSVTSNTASIPANTTASCIPFGASAADVASALQVRSDTTTSHN